jgi:hypothetical protein
MDGRRCRQDHGMDQKLRSSIIMISFKPSQMSCCVIGASATCTGDAALDP